MMVVPVAVADLRGCLLLLTAACVDARYPRSFMILSRGFQVDFMF
jgi:hypothetical protein